MRTEDFLVGRLDEVQAVLLLVSLSLLVADGLYAEVEQRSWVGEVCRERAGELR